MGAPREEVEKVAELRRSRPFDREPTQEQKEEAAARAAEKAKLSSHLSGEFAGMQRDYPTAWNVVQNLYRMLPLEGTSADKALQRQGLRQVADYMADQALLSEQSDG